MILEYWKLLYSAEQKSAYVKTLWILGVQEKRVCEVEIYLFAFELL